MQIPEEISIPAAVAAAAAYAALFVSALVFIPGDSITASSNKTVILAARLAVVAGLFLLIPIIQDTLAYFITFDAFRSTALSVVTITTMSVTEMLLITQIDARQLADGKDPREVGVWELAHRAFPLIFNLRRIRTKWQAKNVPEMRPQSRMYFVLVTFAQVALYYLILDVITMSPPPEPHFVAWEKQTFLLWNLSKDDLIFRFAGILGFWISMYFFLGVVRYSTAGLFVLLGVTEPESWPPLYGPLSSVYTIRGFWG